MSAKPNFYSTFMQEGFFPGANKIIKFQESENYWIFKTGQKVFKVKKEIETASSVPLEEIFCREVVDQIKSHSPGLEPEVLTVKKSKGSYIIDWENTLSEKPEYYIISMNQIPDRGFLSNIIEKKKLTEATLAQISQHLFQFHQQTKVCESKETGSPDLLLTKLDDLFYQSKKYLNVTITKAIIDMTFRPLQRYLADNRKLFFKRIRKDHIRLIHGCLIPRKIHSSKEGIFLLGRTTDPVKHRYNDITADLADFTVELNRFDLPDFSDYFIDSYIKVSADKELKNILPIYQAIRCLNLGLKHSIYSAQTEDKTAKEEQMLAKNYYEQTVEVTRGL